MLEWPFAMKVIFVDLEVHSSFQNLIFLFSIQLQFYHLYPELSILENQYCFDWSIPSVQDLKKMISQDYLKADFIKNIFNFLIDKIIL